MPYKNRKDYNAYMNEYGKKRYRSRRQDALKHLGGVCVTCGSKENLEFDHTNPDNKDYAIGKIIAGHNLDKVYKELEKCQLLCKSCHLEKSKKEKSFRDRETSKVCVCGEKFNSIKSYAGHKSWCNV